MGIVAAGIMPHPPIIIPEVGRGEQQKAAGTIEAMKEISSRLAGFSEETVIIITPHGPMFRDAVAILDDTHLYGDFAAFMAPDVRIRADNDPELVRSIETESRKAGIDVALLRERGSAANRKEFSLDHGVTVPLYYLQQAGVGRRCIAITYAFLSYYELFIFGQAVRNAVEALSRRVIVIASSDLSHRLIKGAPAGFNPRGEEFDRLLVNYIEDYQVEKILTMEPGLVHAAGECGLRSIAVLLGCLDSEEVKAEVLSYEGPFGVGYAVALLNLQRKGNGSID